MSMINKRTTPIDEDEGLVHHVVFTPEIDVHTNINTDFSIVQDIDEVVDVDGYSGWGFRKLIPDNVRAYDLVHDNSNASGITFPPPGISQFHSNPPGRKWMGGGVSDGSSYMKIDDHAWFDTTSLGIALWYNLPATDAGDTDGQMLIVKPGQFKIQIQPHATAANTIRCAVWKSSVQQEVDFTYTPDTWESLIFAATNTELYVYKNNVSQGSNSYTSPRDTTSDDVAIYAWTNGTFPLNSGAALAGLTILDKNLQSDSTWRSDYHDKGLIDLEDSSSTEITTIPFQGSIDEKPNSEAGMFIAT